MAMQLAVSNLSTVTNEDRVGKFLINFITALVAKGYTVQGSGDGLSAYQNAGQTAGPYNVFTSGLGYHTGGGTWNGSNGGANKISNARAWVRLREPSPSTREFIIQRSSGTSNLYELYTIMGIAYAGYLANNATANTPPTSAGTSQVFFGTAFNGLGAEWLPNQSSGTIMAGSHTVIWNAMIEDTVRAGNSLPFFVMSYNSTGAARGCAWIYESMLESVPSDPDPVINCAGTFDVVYGTPNSTPSQSFFGRRDDGTALTALKVASITIPTFGAVPLVSPNANPLDSKVRGFPCYIASAVAADGRHKGVMEHFMLNPTARNYPHTHDKAGADPKIYLGHFCADWANVVPGT